MIMCAVTGACCGPAKEIWGGGHICPPSLSPYALLVNYHVGFVHSNHFVWFSFQIARDKLKYDMNIAGMTVREL